MTTTAAATMTAPRQTPRRLARISELTAALVENLINHGAQSHATSREALALIRKGADVNALHEGVPVLHLAAIAAGSDRGGHYAVEILVALLETGAAPLAPCARGMLALERALWSRADQGALALIDAMKQVPGGPEALLAGAADGSSFVSLAARKGLVNAALAMLESGDSLARVNPATGENALMAAISWPLATSADWMVRLITESDLSARDAEGRAAMDLAIEHRNWPFWIALRRHGAPCSTPMATLRAKLSERGVPRNPQMFAWKLHLGDMPEGAERDKVAAWAIARLVSESWLDIGEMASVAPADVCESVLAEARLHPPRMQHAQPFADRLAQLRGQSGE